MASNVAGAKTSSKTKTVVPSQDLSKIVEIRDITYAVLQQFPVLRSAPDVMYYLMATWGAESSWRLFANGTNSLHWTPSPPDKSSLTRAYQNSNVIRNVYDSTSVTPQQRKNVMEGWYPHGITATMGSYMVKGNPNNLIEWRSKPEAVEAINRYGLEVEPGISISQTLFPVDNVTCRTRSIASGIIIFNSKYCFGLKKFSGNASKAMQYAIMIYLGDPGKVDGNGVSPEARAADLNSPAGRATILAKIDIIKTGNTRVLTKNELLAGDIYNKSAKDGGSTKVVNNAAGGPATNSNADGKSGKIPGCEP